MNTTVWLLKVDLQEWNGLYGGASSATLPAVLSDISALRYQYRA
jgi:hypothetical protein